LLPISFHFSFTSFTQKLYSLFHLRVLGIKYFSKKEGYFSSTQKNITKYEKIFLMFMQKQHHDINKQLVCLKVNTLTFDTCIINNAKLYSRNSK